MKCICAENVGKAEFFRRACIFCLFPPPVTAAEIPETEPVFTNAVSKVPELIAA